jgi:hypothetical protein
LIPNIDSFFNLIRVRIKEAEYFEFYRSHLRKFAQFCSEFRHIDITSIRKQLEYLDSLEDLDLKIKLKEVCQTLDHKRALQAGNISNYDPTVIYFDGVRANFLVIIQHINNLKWEYCVVFKDYFNDASSSLLKSDKAGEYKGKNLDKLIESSWAKAYAKWKQITVDIESGLMKLVTLDTFTIKYFANDFDKFRDEFIYINTYFKIKSLDYRNKQIILYNKFKMSYSAALEIDRIHKQLSLINKFQELDDLLNIKSESFKQWDLNKMDEKIEKTVTVLDRINDKEKIDCLNAYTESLGLVDWLRQNAPSLSELKFLVDLASMSTSTNTDTSLDKTVFAKTLKEAGTAFAFLIYELKVDVTFYQFMGLCEKVCSHLESDRSIAAKLLAVKDKVELLEEIKKKKGNVELTSIESAQDINQNGVYRIKLQLDGGLSKEDTMTISDLISLEFKTKEKDIVYTHDQLLELQNVLSLIAPRKVKKGEANTVAGDDDMDITDEQSGEHESQTLDYFIALFSSVERLAEIYLKLLHDGCLFFDSFEVVIHSDITKKLFERKQPVLEICFMNNRAVIKDTKGDTLSSISCLCSLMEQAFENWSVYVSNLRDSFNSLNYFTLAQIKYLLVNLNSLVTNSMLESNEFDMVCSILSILNNDLDEKKVLDECKRPIDARILEARKSADDLKFTSDASSQRTDLESEFIQKWMDYLRHQNLVQVEAITLRHLAILLDSLEESNKTFVQIKRTVPGYLVHVGEPNLIVCSQHEQIQTALSIYALSPNQPMPKNDEILICTTQTTTEEVENFLRIVFKSTGNKIYTLMNIHDLAYEATERVEKFLQSSNAVLTKTSKFVLVIMCSQEKHSQSILASLYAKNKIKPVILSSENLENYVNQKFFRKKDRKFLLTNYDPDFSAARVLISRSSGNGKSQYVKELVQRIKSNAKNVFNYQIIRIKSSTLNLDAEIDKFFALKAESGSSHPTLFHIDVAYEVFHNLDHYLFSLFILNYLKHTNGMVWRRNADTDLYIIEITPPLMLHSDKLLAIHSMINYLPKIEFKTPNRHLYDLRNGSTGSGPVPNLFSSLYKSEMYQRSCFYIKLINEFRERRATRDRQVLSDKSNSHHRENRGNNNNNNSNNAQKIVSYEKLDEIDEILNQRFDSATTMSEQECLEVIMKNSGLTEPNWHEIKNYCSFLNSNLELVDKSELIKTVVGKQTISFYF